MRYTNTLKFCMGTIVCLSLLMTFSADAAGKMYHKISKEEARELIDKANVIFFDVREDNDWASSQYRIKSALRLDLKKTNLTDLNLSNDVTLVLY